VLIAVGFKFFVFVSAGFKAVILQLCASAETAGLEFADFRNGRRLPLHSK
jgi:hypothetical protein